MSRFDTALKFTLPHEGGTGEQAGDPDTAFGITQPVYDKWRRTRSLPERDVDDISAEEKFAVYFEFFWIAAKCDRLPAPLDVLHFDTTVNCGQDAAGRMLQAALGMNLVDGIVGGNTLKAVAASDTSITFAKYINNRITRYVVLARGNAKHRASLNGWLHRCGDLLKIV